MEAPKAPPLTLHMVGGVGVRIVGDGRECAVAYIINGNLARTTRSHDEIKSNRPRFPSNFFGKGVRL